MAKISKTVTFDFEFINADGEEDIRELTMKSAQLAPGEVVEQFLLGELAGTVAMLKWALSVEDHGWFQMIPYKINLNPLYDQWQKVSQVDVGKSEASSPS